MEKCGVRRTKKTPEPGYGEAHPAQEIPAQAVGHPCNSALLRLACYSIHPATGGAPLRNI